MPAATIRPRFDLQTAFSVRAAEGGRRSPRRMRALAFGDAPQVTPEHGPTGRPRRDPAARLRAMVIGPRGRMRMDPFGTLGFGAERQRPTDTPHTAPIRVIENPTSLIFTVLETESGGLSTEEIHLLSAGRQLADQIAGEGGAAVVAIASGVPDGLAEAGADRVISQPSPQTGQYREEWFASQLSNSITTLRPHHVLFPDTLSGRDLAARVASQLGTKPIFGVHQIEAGNCVRVGFGGTKDLTSRTPLILSVAESFSASPVAEWGEASDLAIEGPQGPAQDLIEDLGLLPVTGADLPLEEAPFVISAGVGVHDWTAFDAVTTEVNATQAASRVVCDRGDRPRDRQVGASGRLSTAECYVALGISGAMHHLQGIEACNSVVAVNTDANAAIMKRADLAIVGDANEILRALARKLGGGAT